MPIEKELIVPPAEYPPWIKELVEDLNADKIGGGVEHIRKFRYAGGFSPPDEFYVRFKGGSDGHSARLLRGVLDKHYGWFWMKYFVWPALMAQGMGKENEE